MGAITDLWKSERGLLAVLIIIAASVLAGLDRMSVADWQTFVTGIFITYVSAKTVTGAVAIFKSAPTEPATTATEAATEPQIVNAIIRIALVLGLSGASCKPYVGPVTHVVIDCLAQDQSKLESLALELLPFLAGESPNWAAFKEKAIGAGVNIGGCVAADLLQKYLAPPPGNAAPSPENGLAARATMEEIRGSFNGSAFKTKAGTL